MLYVKMILYIVCASLLVAVCAVVKEYRVDYRYYRKTDAFYKLHTESVQYNIANETCEREGAKLLRAFPRDITQAHIMLKEFPDIGDLIWAIDDGLPHELAAEDITAYVYEPDKMKYYNDVVKRGYLRSSRSCEVISRQGELLKTACFHTCPFICKVEAKDIYVNSQCNVFSRGYQYVESVGSCYKISSSKVTWNQAFAECQGEGAHLLILNSDLERQAVHNLTRSESNISNKGFLSYIAGIRVENTKGGSPRVFKTIFGKTLEEAGYAEWSSGEPNEDQDKVCGSISRKDGKYNDIFCNHHGAFICEKEITGKKND